MRLLLHAAHRKEGSLGCPICESGATSRFLRRSAAPIHQNLVIARQCEAVAIARGELDLFVCTACGFAYNRSFEPKKLSYGARYDNAQSHSPAFAQHMDSLIRHIVTERGVRSSRIIEVGCGQGDFLHRLVSFEGAGNTGIGFDPSYRGERVALSEQLRFHRRYFDGSPVGEQADVAISRHVIEHVPEPVAFLRSIRRAVAPGARLFLETPCLRWILRNRVVWDFFYEHCSYFTSDSLRTAVERAGFEVEDARHVFGGQYLWLEARAVVSPLPSTRRLGDTLLLCGEFGGEESQLVGRWRSRVEALRATGSVALWGAGAKGVTLANLIDPQRERLTCVVDVNPTKQGSFIPGTGHLIIAPRDLPVHQVRHAILMNPAYRQENLALLRECGLDVSLVSFSYSGSSPSSKPKHCSLLSERPSRPG